MNNSLSQRGQTASQSALRIDFEAYFEAVKNLYHETENPEGSFPLNIAENKLSWPILKTHMMQLANQHAIPNWVANYTNSTGSITFRDKVASFYSKFLTGCKINPEHLALSAGSTSVIDLTSWILGEPGDVAVFPAPCYPVYKQDIQNKSGLERYDLITHHHIKDIENGPLLSVDHLNKALKDIENKGKRFRILVITNPDNPTGGMYPQSKLNEFADWCISHNIHMIVNEIYGLSLINTQHPELKDDYPAPVTFYSFANIMQKKQSEYLHHWYALSKDFGASGFRVGMVYSLNKTFIEAYHNLNGPSMVSNYTQWMFELVFSDEDFVEKYIKTNQQLLTENYLIVVRLLRRLKVPYAPAQGSLFVWLDLSEFLKENTQTLETKLWNDLYNQTGILLTPGNGFGHTQHGQFRLVHSCFSQKELEVAMDRLAQFIKNKRKS
ncbi:MAG TPA: aminotransferase class I/II-fold pyridoxal phosphate-dependent enzyme [Cyclobacteriaceae bacterium]|nr:aminotransferase class I/II-fold pyridoxal phosphate-dependent enzyme [Cyclobacteriaceae bacterium]